MYYEDATQEKDYRIYEADHSLKRKIWRPQLTAAKLQCSIYDRKLFFGKPDPLLELEQLSGTLSLQELRDIFNGLIECYKQVAEAEGWFPPMMPIDLHTTLKELGTKHFKH